MDRLFGRKDDSDGEKNRRNFEDYVSQLKFSCEKKKNVEDCDRLGQVYLKAYKDTAAAFKVFEKNCYVNQFGASCLTVGDYYYTGSHRPGSDRNMTAALHAYELGCDAFFSPACIQAGRILVLDKKITNMQRGVEFFERGCNGDNAEACALAAHMYHYGRRGFDTNSVKALEYAIKACDKDVAAGCKSASELYLNGGVGVPKDWEQYQYYRKKHNLLEKLNKIENA